MLAVDQCSPERMAIEPARDRARDLLGRVFGRVVSSGAEGDDVELGDRAARPLDDVGRVAEPGPIEGEEQLGTWGPRAFSRAIQRSG